MRAVPEWRGRTDNEAVPPRVKVRIFDRAGKCCENCLRSIVGKLRPQFDHRIALVNGGENRETNIQLLCHECHGQKTKQDVAEKSRTYARKKKDAGIRAKSKFACSRDSGFKKKLTGEVVRR